MRCKIIITELSQWIIVMFVYVSINPIRDGLLTGDLTWTFHSHTHTTDRHTGQDYSLTQFRLGAHNSSPGFLSSQYCCQAVKAWPKSVVTNLFWAEITFWVKMQAKMYLSDFCFKRCLKNISLCNINLFKTVLQQWHLCSRLNTLSLFLSCPANVLLRPF